MFSNLNDDWSACIDSCVATLEANPDLDYIHFSTSEQSCICVWISEREGGVMIDISEIQYF